MDEREFNRLADEMLLRIEQFLEGCEPELDYEIGAGGVIEIDFDGDSDPAGGGKIVVNRHTAAREIWIAAKSGGFHFRPDTSTPGHWVGTRDGVELLTQLSRCISEQSGDSIRFPAAAG